MENSKEQHRELVIKMLESDTISNEQIIDLLLLLLDDWKVRAAVMHQQFKRSQSVTTQVTTQVNKKAA